MKPNALNANFISSVGLWSTVLVSMGNVREKPVAVPDHKEALKYCAQTILQIRSLHYISNAISAERMTVNKVKPLIVSMQDRNFVFLKLGLCLARRKGARGVAT
jgi:7-cyano-7-deazaguanine synthase in queuosine biosynthesis